MFRLPYLAVSIGVCSLPSPTATAQTTIYVDIANCPGLGSGTQVDPFCLIQDGIDEAVDGDTVLIADGTYTGIGNKNLSFDGKATRSKVTRVKPVRVWTRPTICQVLYQWRNEYW